MVLISMRMEKVKMVRYVMCGMTSSNGTDKGKLKKVGRRTVKTGMDSSRFDWWGWNRVQASFVLSMMVRQVRKRIHSKETLVRLFM